MPRPTRRPQTRRPAPQVENDTPPADESVRVQKLLASAGIGSRRHCEEYILAGRVTIDGRVVRELGVRVDPSKQKVTIDGEVIRSQRKLYYLLNKPTGYLCTNSDPHGRARAIDLIPKADTRLFTVGRLDENSQGLLLLTNDGELAHRLAHPRFQAERIYRVQVAGKPTPETLNSLKEGVHFAQGKFRIKGYRRAQTKGKSTFLEIVLTEGQNREIRRLFAKVGHKVMMLQRVGFGPLRLGRLGIGKARLLRNEELADLRALAQESPGSSPRSKPRRGRKTSTAGKSRAGGASKKAGTSKTGTKRSTSPTGRSGTASTRSSTKQSSTTKSSGKKTASKNFAGKKPTGKKPTGKRPATKKAGPKSGQRRRTR